MTTQYIYNMVDTWNDGATTFTSIKMDVTDSASNASSLLMDLQVSTVSKFSVSKTGSATFALSAAFPGGTTSTLPIQLSSSGYGFYRGSAGGGGAVITTCAGTDIFAVGQNNGVGVINTGPYAWATTIASTPDLFLTRRAAANLRFGAADAAGSAISISSVATNQLTLASSHGLTSGAAVIITGTTAPSGTSLNTLYYARSISAAVIELYLTFDTATATSGTTGIVAVTTAGTSASIRLATPFQRLSPQDFTGTDIPGQPLLINGSRGTGTGPGGSITFQVAPAGSTGATQNALSTALTIDSTRIATFALSAAFPGGTTSTLPIQLSSSGYGFYRGSSGGGGAVITTCAGTDIFAVGQNSGVGVVNTGPYTWASTIASTQDLFLWRDDANKLALRNGGTNASPVSQQFNVYKFWISSTDYSRLEVGNSADANTHYLYATQSGTGTARDLLIGTSGAKDLLIYTNASLKWTVNSSGHFLAGTDNLYDIGASGATRPRNVYIAGLADIGASAGINGILYLKTSGSITAQITAPLSGIITLQNAAGGDFDRINYGGTTSAFPALKRNGAGFDVVGADGTNVSFVRVPGVAVASLPSASTAGVGARSFVTDATATTYASTVAGGGGNKVPVFSNGTNWLIG